MDNSNTPKTASQYKKEIGASGTYDFSGIISGEEYNTNLIGANAKRVYDIMRRSDSSVHAALQACKLPIRSLEFTIEAASEDDADQKIAEFVTRELFDRNVNFSDYLREALTMFDFGFSVFEKVYEVCEFDGKQYIGIAKLASRKQRSIIKWRMDNGKLGVHQQLVGQTTAYADIPMEKLIVLTNDREGDNYEGISVLRFCYKDWDMKDKLGLVHGIALEKHGVGIPIIKPPAGADEASKTEAFNNARMVRANEEAAIMVPNDWGFEMMDMASGGTRDILPTIQYYNQQIMLSVLAQFLMLGSSGSSGSRSTSEDHSKLFMLSEEAAVKNFVEATQNQLIKQLCDLNFTDMPNGYPKLKSSRVADDDVTTLAAAMNQLASAKLLTPDANLEQFVRDTLHAPDLSEEDRANYDTLREQSMAASAAATEVLNNPPEPDLNDGKDKTVKPVKAAAIKQLMRSNDQLIDVVLRS